MKIFGWCASLEDGCFHYRMKLPLDELARHGHDVQYSTQLGPWAREEADIIIGQRIAMPGSTAGWLTLAREGRAKLVYEVDDDLFSIHELSNPYAEFFRRPSIRRNMENALRAADLVTASTEPLADVLRQYNPNVVVLPNRVPASMLAAQAPPRRDHTLIGWQGSDTHARDWGFIQPAVAAVMRDRPQTRMRFLGAAMPAGLPVSRWDWLPWTTDLEQHFRRQTEFDVALAPLRASTFNRSKSGIRFIESAALGVPMLCADSAAYRPWVEHGKTGFLLRNMGQWGVTLRDMVDDAAMRAEVGAAARQAAADWTIEKNWTAWQDAYAALL